MKRRLLIFALATALIASIAAPVFAQETSAAVDAQVVEQTEEVSVEAADISEAAVSEDTTVVEAGEEVVAAQAEDEEYSNLFVCLMGICTVFIGLICIIVLVSVMSGIVRKTEKAAGNKAANNSAAPSAAKAPAAQQSALTAETVAAISAAIAEEMGADVSAIRIVSLKKVQA